MAKFKSRGRVYYKKKKLQIFREKHLNYGALADLKYDYKQWHDVTIKDINQSFRKGIREDCTVLFEYKGKTKILQYNN